MPGGREGRHGLTDKVTQEVAWRNWREPGRRVGGESRAQRKQWGRGKMVRDNRGWGRGQFKPQRVDFILRWDVFGGFGADEWHLTSYLWNLLFKGIHRRSICTTDKIGDALVKEGAPRDLRQLFPLFPSLLWSNSLKMSTKSVASKLSQPVPQELYNPAQPIFSKGHSWGTAKRSKSSCWHTAEEQECCQKNQSFVPLLVKHPPRHQTRQPLFPPPTPQLFSFRASLEIHFNLISLV